MKDKYSQPKREQYGRRLAAHLCDQHFAAQPTATLDGPAVLRFTPIRQVNLFVVQQLLAQWTGEMARLRSPYFDFEAEDVRQALTQFMNTLSRRIRLSREAFEPLLARAISDTLGVVMDSALTFEEKLLGAQPTATQEQLREPLRYLDIDKPLFQGFIDTLTPGTPLEREFLLNRFRLYQEANYKNHQPLEKLIGEFSALLPITVADLWTDGPVATPPAPVPAAAPVAPAAPAAPAAEAAPQPAELEPEPAPVPAQTAPTAAKAKAEAVPEPVAPAVAPPQFTIPAPATPSAAPAPEATAVTPEPARRPLNEAAPNGTVPLYEKLKAEHAAPASLSETLRPENTVTTLADKSAPKVESLREAISINQRFSFINELFNGENMEYHTAIQHLDSLHSAEAAKRYVTQELAGKYGWVRKEEHINKLLKLLDRKFA
ncbi:hypothetical protein SAMN02745146_0304 [Hymenobacter daecheongensis DSM 21074]|uniref:Uncharacterized protein n=1 Tax=Hymenobacter daecheongensis DSM 21074 TaxID=1121955 RepID=A0A1M6MJR8_9BACT|nr:hypothetical protein [Hymenobacter daecheongensis]SHJ83722.1 hypothetical protein SAMN02745146_0304 [Hymenobacter daecheongensis DSM 21074]